jgi:hypothetical protein
LERHAQTSLSEIDRLRVSSNLLAHVSGGFVPLTVAGGTHQPETYSN